MMSAAQQFGTPANWRLEAEHRRRALEALPDGADARGPNQNHLLGALPSDVQARLRPHLELVSLPLGKVLYECGAVQRHVYFPVDCIVSLIYEMENGSSAEVSVVGREGIVGLASFMGGQSTTCRVVVHCAGFAYRLPGDTLQAEFERQGPVCLLMLRYTQALIAQISQTAVCNRHHSIEQQLCRCLLRCLDRLPSSEFAMTQELMANMLGVRREGVTCAAIKLKKLGVIRYSRGKMRVLDRPRLEDLSCECYSLVKEESDRLLRFPLPQPRPRVA